MSVVAAIGLAVGLAGTAIQYTSQQKMIKEQKRASTKAENAREQQMALNAQRKRRQAVRESLVARATSLSVGANQGAQYGSGVAGGMAGATAQGASNQQTINASETLGGRVFQANREYYNATASGQSGMALGGAISSLGGALVNNAGTINKLGTYYGTPKQGASGFGS